MEFKTKEEYVAEFLREGIIGGRFPRGVRLKQDEIARLLKISITPVREAFRILETEGYIISEQHRGVIVASFDAHTAHELTGLRVLLECRLVAAAMAKVNRAHFDQLAKLQSELEKASHRGDWAQIRAGNYRFHSYLYGIAELPQTLHFVQILWARYPFDLIHKVKGRPERAVKEHAVLLKALAAGDKALALKAAKEHIESGWHVLSEHLKTETDSGTNRLASPKNNVRAGVQPKRTPGSRAGILNITQ